MPRRRDNGRMANLDAIAVAARPPGPRRTALRRPFALTTLRQLLFCLTGVVFVAAVVLTLTYGPFGLAYLVRGGPTPLRASVTLSFLALLVLAAPLGRVVGLVQRGLAARLLGEEIAAPARRSATGGPLRRLGRAIADPAGWRAVAYTVLKLPLGIVEAYAVFCAVIGLANLSYPLWWPLFRNHPPGVQLDPVTVLTPFGAFDVATFPGTFAAAAAGAAMLLVAPWLARGGCALDRAAMRGLLGPGRVDARVRQLQESRARVIDDSAATLRRLERDLHDGAQIRLATVAMNLGMAMEKLDNDEPEAELAQARELVAAAHRGAKDALAELRDLVRGIQPPVLDQGLPDALATLASTGPIPVALTIDLPRRPAPGIETIAYFCTTELLANAAKHSRASRIAVEVRERDERLLLSVLDDGRGGADPARGTGLAGLAQRVSSVDGMIRVESPAGGPTRATVELPMRP
jgi:signal transduction histidine kinase